MATTGRIPSEILDEIRERTSIEKVVGEYVPLKRAGRHFKGPCPFHQEKTPSFTVNTDLQIFKCFGCGESGNVFTFLMKFESIAFLEAVERLAQQAGVALPEYKQETKEQRSDKEIIVSVMKRAWMEYHKLLLQSSIAKNAREYLESRGFGSNEIKKYGIGYAPEQWDFIIKAINVPMKVLVSAGLVVEKQESAKYYDRFRNRIIFPIREHRRGEVVAFGGRTLGDDPAKYINSPESPIYNKSRVLYGLYEAKKAIRKSREVILVEGYFDRLALDLHGISNVVAPCGTSLTEQQVKLIKQSAQTLYLFFDADAAGVSAAKRGLELCLGSGLETLAVPMPDGLDPDDYVNAEKADGVNKLLAKAKPAIDFLILSAGTRNDISRSSGRRQTVEEMIPFLLDVENSIDQGTYIARIADLVRVPPESVMELLKRFRLRERQRNRKNQENGMERFRENVSLEQIDRNIFGFFIRNPEYINWDENPIIPEAMQNPIARQIYQLFRSDMNDYGSLSVARILDHVTQAPIKKLIVDLFDDPGLVHRLVLDDPAAIFQSLVKEYETRRLKTELNFLRNRLMTETMSSTEADNLLKKQEEILVALNSNKMS